MILCAAAYGRTIVEMGNNLENVQRQNQFLHREVRLPRVEILDMLCTRLGMPKTRSSYQKMNRLHWTFGQKMITRNGATFWATDSQYFCPTSENKSRRREIFLLRGTEKIKVKLPNGDVTQKNTAFCCEAICFMTIGNLRELQAQLSRSTNVFSEVQDGTYDHMQY